MPNLDDGSDADRDEFIANMSTQVSHVLDNPDEFWIAHRVTGNPTGVYVSADGSTETVTGARGPQDLLKKLQAMASNA
ncbi:MAG: hypothetical protein ACI81L_001549 [Verrucomicrobiales bacterium]